MKRINLLNMALLAIIFAFIIITFYSIKTITKTHNYHIEKYVEDYMAQKRELIKHDITFILKEYINTINDSNQKEILQKISQISYEDGRYIFIFKHFPAEHKVMPLVNSIKRFWEKSSRNKNLSYISKNHGTFTLFVDLHQFFIPLLS